MNCPVCKFPLCPNPDCLECHSLHCPRGTLPHIGCYDEMTPGEREVLEYEQAERAVARREAAECEAIEHGGEL